MFEMLTYESSNGSRTAKVYMTDDGGFEVVCMVAGQCSRAFPVKTLKTRKGAIDRAHRFLNA